MLYVSQEFVTFNLGPFTEIFIIKGNGKGKFIAFLIKVGILHSHCFEHFLLLQIFLVGQEGLMEVIRSPHMEQLQQRLIAASRLEPLELDETRAYIVHRLSKVGWRADPAFSEEVFGLIHKFSGGVPRRINLICHRLFLRGGIEGKHELHGDDALTVIVELHKEGLLHPVASKALA